MLEHLLCVGLSQTRLTIDEEMRMLYGPVPCSHF
jgi:hypothetical protein